MSFQNPGLYNKTNTEVLMIKTKRFLEKNWKRITWKGCDRILDVGSGDGRTSTEVLKSFLPNDFEQLIGIDKSEPMVLFANQHYKDAKVEFRLLDFRHDLPEHFIGSFEHVFSFYAMNYIKDQRKAYSQIYDALSDNGDCLLLIVGHSPALFSVYQKLAKTKKWSPWVRDLDEHIPMYHGCEDTEGEALQLMGNAGFKDIYVKCVDTSFTFESDEHYKNFVEAINPFEIPENLKKEYFNEFLNVAKKNGFIDENLKIKYILINIFGRKLNFYDTI